MTSIRLLNSAPCFVEITRQNLKACYEKRIIETPLDRSSEGRLTPICKERLKTEFRSLFGHQLIQPRIQVFCAIDARGLSVRRLKLPATTNEECRRLLLLQIESDFPVPPEELAWGFLRVAPDFAALDALATNQQEVVLAAVKKQSLQDYVEIFSACGAKVVFTPAAMARGLLCPKEAGISGQLTLGLIQSEFMTVLDGMPSALRVLPWGEQELSKTEGGSADTQDAPMKRNGQLTLAVNRLADLLAPESVRRTLCLLCAKSQQEELGPMLAQRLGVHCEAISYRDSELSPAIAGLLKATLNGTPLLSLHAELESSKTSTKLIAAARQKWALAAAALIVAALLFPYLEALLCKPRLAHKLAALKADRGRLVAIDRELDLLRYLKQNQPPYLDGFYIISRSIPAGARLESLSMNRRGELALRATVRDINQVADFRSKLIDSGLFSNLAIEEQAPSPDRQKLTLRMTAQWKPDAAHEIAARAVANEPDKPKSAGPGAFPGGMPPGFNEPMPPMAGSVSVPGPGPVSMPPRIQAMPRP